MSRGDFVGVKRAPFVDIDDLIVTWIAIMAIAKVSK